MWGQCATSSAAMQTALGSTGTTVAPVPRICACADSASTSTTAVIGRNTFAACSTVTTTHVPAAAAAVQKRQSS